MRLLYDRLGKYRGSYTKSGRSDAWTSLPKWDAVDLVNNFLSGMTYKDGVPEWRKKN